MRCGLDAGINEPGAQVTPRPRGKSSVLLLGTGGVARIPIIQWLREEPDLEVAGAITLGPEALALVERTKPDLALIDAAGMDGQLLAAVRQMIALSPSTRPVVICDECPGGTLKRALDAGIWGYLHTDAPQRVILWALRAVAAGRLVLHCSLAPEQVGQMASPAPRAGEAVRRSLSRRETAVLAAIAMGETDAQIAGRLSVSVPTVKTHVRSILRKTGARNRAGAIGAGFRDGAL